MNIAKPTRKPSKPRRPKRPADEAAALLAQRRGEWTDRAAIFKEQRHDDDT